MSHAFHSVSRKLIQSTRPIAGLANCFIDTVEIFLWKLIANTTFSNGWFLKAFLYILSILFLKANFDPRSSL